MKQRDKIRITISVTTRITDVEPEIAKVIDVMRGRKTRVQFLRDLTGNPLRTSEDVHQLRDKCLSQGYRSIEEWLRAELGVN